MLTGYKFPLKNSNNNTYATVDLDDVFAPKSDFVENIYGGSLWHWGANADGNMIGATTSSPVNRTTDTKWKFVDTSVSHHVFGIKVDGSLWAWGSNVSGALGLNDLVHRSSPVQVGSARDWVAVTTLDDATSLAIKANGTLWAWGNNNNGRLGLGDIVHRSSPVQVGSLTDWKTLPTSMFATPIVIKTDNTMWTWGVGNDGRLGLGDTLHRSSPVQVGGADWRYATRAVGTTIAVKIDGTLWSWGLGTDGILGLGTTASISSPVQIGTLSNWKTVSAGYYHAVAIKTDGTLWVWGRNTGGQLGLNDLVHRSSPVQVGSLTNWRYPSATFNESACIKTDGTLWMWGHNGAQAGADDNFPRSSPIQVGSLQDWKLVSCGANTTFAIRDQY